MTTDLPTSQIKIPPGTIDLGLGDPPFSLLPLDLLRRAAEIRFAEEDPAFLQYGAEQGDGRFRLALADFLSRGYEVPVEAGSLFVTNGVSNGLDLICSLFTQAGDVIFVEEPSYFLALRIFADHKLRVVSIDTDENGLVLEDLEAKLQQHRPKLLYLIPTFQNPSGHSLPQERRDRLVELCQQQDFVILADEVYHFLSYSGAPPRPFAARADLTNVISLGSFSKILAPGLRLGWVQANADTIERLAGCGLLDSGGGLNPFTSGIVCQVIESGGVEQNISKLREIYRARVELMDAALTRYLPGASYLVPGGGYFFWVRLAGGADSLELRQRARSSQVDFRPGALFSSRGGLGDFVRLCFIFHEPAEIEEGLRRLGACLDGG